ncbi:nicotinamide-nucleotide amidohydrolase family protein [Paenarthrobacter sp. DKR-5]|uniref:CinA family protein n=1 Tax=Paenarthrobacter sp. DKR-5 TaxID=2835535 RepID=UPI001BDBB267|nr:CinA family protein [Paenarthrobacter sp. DKR-5]MBT1002725.1 nicotinamide-nucleotide amidohydrolase family protein [Paenarthrobacter sp. DKR-5]
MAPDEPQPGLPEQVIAAAVAAGATVASAESLTGGLVCATLVQVPGASAALQGGVVAYQNSVKAAVLGVDEELLATAGSVDAGVAEAMAAGARRATGATFGVSTTGVAGPEPHDGKPVGTVFVGVSGPEGERSFGYLFTGDRAAVRAQACTAALERLHEALGTAR